MVDLLAEDPRPHQSPTLSEPEAARAYVRIAPQHAVVWLMTTPDAPEAPDVDAVLAGLLHRPEWHQRAACSGMGTDAFVIAHRAHYEDRARELCAGCAVRQECLEKALADSETVGLWGGTTPMERRVLRRRVA